jgi:hypothetical protein
LGHGDFELIPPILQVVKTHPTANMAFFNTVYCKDLSTPSRWTVPLMYMLYLIIRYVNIYTVMVGLTGWTETTRCTTGGIGVLQRCQAPPLTYASDIHTLLKGV